MKIIVCKIQSACVFAIHRVVSAIARKIEVTSIQEKSALNLYPIAAIWDRNSSVIRSLGKENIMHFENLEAIIEFAIEKEREAAEF